MMATVVRAWRVEDDEPTEIHELPASEQGLLEKRLEGWLEREPDAIRDDLMIIGRQVSTASGPLDLLAINQDGVLTVVEIKRDRAPRETVAQAIDYASWIADQTVEDLADLADSYLKRSLEEAFLARFGEPLPELDPANVSVIVVASRLDAHTERMIQFLSRQYGMDIDGLLFRFIRLPSGEQLLIRTSVVSEERRAERRERGRPSAQALVALAKERKAENVIKELRKLSEFLSEIPDKTYRGSFRYWTPGRMLVGVNASGYWNPPPGALDVWVTYSHWSQAYGLDEAAAVDALKAFGVVQHYAGSHQLVLRIESESEARKLVSLLRGWSETATAEVVPTAPTK